MFELFISWPSVHLRRVSQLSYVGSDHWAAILDSIVDIREHFEEQEQFHLTRHSQDSVNDIGGYIETELPRSSHALLLYGSVPFASRSEVLSALPPKNAADRYVSRYFNRLDLVHSIVHGPTFLREMGMPRMISDSKCDTLEPRNLSDTDLEQDPNELPESRPESEFTPALGIIARRRIFLALGAITDLTSTVHPCSYADVKKVDSILREALEKIPLLLRPKPMASSVTDPPELIMSRLFLECLFHKGQLMLHQRFLHRESPSCNEDAFAYSRMACVTAALGALEIQNILDEETRPGGQLRMMRWRVSSILNNIFLTATMVLCSMLHRGRTLGKTNDIVRALKKARSVWLCASLGSQEANKAAKTVSFVLARAGDGHGMLGGKEIEVGSGEDGGTTRDNNGFSGGHGKSRADSPSQRQDVWQYNNVVGLDIQIYSGILNVSQLQCRSMLKEARGRLI
ncbi:hypothetical protein VTH82DRAFT_1787 [Thermothelomyces myriococcoides]